MEIKNLEPKIVWEIFDAITKVPRPSKKEEQIRAWLVDFAKKNNIECHVDETGNLLLRKPATPGREDRETIVMQGHIDMVCEKNSNITHDFEKDPIETMIVNGWVTANGTTLGADNGIGVAMGLAALTDDSFEHGPLEVLCTYDEETGMTGANNIKEGFMTGKILINLDSETENQIFIGCAGGLDTLATWKYKAEEAPKNLYYCKVSVSGLLGGHSGGDIHLGHANANKVLCRFLLSQPEIVIAKIDGGNLRNAIAREAYAVIGLPMSAKDQLVADLNKYVAVIEGEVGDIEKGFKMNIETVDTPAIIIEPAVAKQVLMAVEGTPHGVLGMSRSMPGLVETSTNLASVKMVGDNEIQIATSQRSSVESAKLDAGLQVETCFKLAGAEVVHRSSYPGWKPNIESPIMKVCQQAYRDVFKSEPEITAIHAGLETGLFLTKYPYMDMVSIGPTMEGVHSPDERLNIESVGRFYPYLKEILSRI